MLNNIRKTLLKSLFHNKPPFMGDILQEHFERVFPGHQDFIRFLEETDNQKLTNIAESLLIRLARESGLFIPSKLLLSLLETEEKYAPDTVSSHYIPQDHFVHILNMYLLGIYVFTHHKKFNRTLSHYFENFRQEHLPTSSINSDDASFSDFIFCWRTFALMHDIAYPYELPLNNSKQGDEGKVVLEQIRDRYHQLHSYVANEMALSFLARIFSWYQADDSLPHPSCENVLKSFFDSIKTNNYNNELFPQMNALLEFPNLEDWRGAARMPILHGRRFLSIANTVFIPSDMLAILIHSRSGNVALAINHDGKRKPIVKAFGQHLNLSNISEDLLVQHAFYSGTTPRVSSQADYEWHIFIRNYDKGKESFVKSLKIFDCKYVNPKLVKKVYESFSAMVPASIMTITSDLDFRGYENWMHAGLHSWWKEIPLELYAEEISDYKILTSDLISIKNSITNIITNEIQKRMVGVVSNIVKDNNANNLKANISDIVINSLKPIKNDLDLPAELVDMIYNSIHSEFGVVVDRLRLMHDILSIAKRIVPLPLYTNANESSYVKLNKIAQNYTNELILINKLLYESKLPNLQDLIKQYRPRFIDKESCDHGLAATLFLVKLAHCNSGISEIINKANQISSEDTAKVLGKFVQISLCMGDEASLDDFQYRGKSLIAEVGRAIAIHNIYPKYLENQGSQSFRVDLKREPFCYFAMIVDAIQCWDRNRRLWQNTTDVPYKTSGDNYDIRIEGDWIRIREHNYGLDINKRSDALRDGLETYIHGAKHFIGLDLAEWKDRIE